MYVKQRELLIRNAESRDAATLCEWWNDGEVMAHAGFPLGLGTTPDAVRAQLAVDDDNARRCIIEFHGVLIGEMNYRAKGDRTAEIGIKICAAEYRDRGLGTRLLEMFIGELFGRYSFETIKLDTNQKNTRAQHVYEKLGFTRTGIAQNSWRNQLGEPQTQIYYELKIQDSRFSQ